MSIDVISQICIFCDYPLYRAMLTKYRSKFNKIILYPSRQHGVIDLESFLRNNFPETWVTGHQVDWSKPNVDWRQEETEPCLALSDSEWVLFMEQDFFVKDWDKFWTDIEKAMEYSDAIGYWNSTHFPYLHPCFLLIKREVLDKTQKDFSAHAEINGCDHFAMITRDLEKLEAKITTIQDLGYIEWENMFHLGSLTYTYQDWGGGIETDRIGAKSPEAFMVYNHFIRQSTVPQNPEFIKLSIEVEDFFKPRFPDLNLEENKWTPYFK